MLLRLVRVVPGERDSRRRVPISDLSGTDLDPVALSEVLEQLARHRLISLDRDAATAEGTVELAHEALLWEWDRYAGWVERHRAALGERDALLRAVEEWESSGKDADFLLKGRRLEKFATWSAQAGLRMTAREEELLAASLALERSEAAQRTEQERAVRRQQRRSRRRVIALAVAVVLLGTAAGAAVLMTRPGPPTRHASGCCSATPGPRWTRAFAQPSTMRWPPTTSLRWSGSPSQTRRCPRSVVCPPSRSTSSSSAPSRPTSTRSPDDIPGSGTSSSTTSATSPT